MPLAPTLSLFSPTQPGLCLLFLLCPSLLCIKDWNCPSHDKEPFLVLRGTCGACSLSGLHLSGPLLPGVEPKGITGYLLKARPWPQLVSLPFYREDIRKSLVGKTESVSGKEGSSGLHMRQFPVLWDWKLIQFGRPLLFNKNNIKLQTHNQVHFRKKEAIARNLENLGDFLRVLLPEMLIQKISSHYLAASSQSKHGWPLSVSSVSPTSERLFIFL